MTSEIEILKIGEILPQSISNNETQVIRIGVGSNILDYYYSKLRLITNYKFIEHDVNEVKKFNSQTLFADRQSIKIGQYKTGTIYKEITVGDSITLNGDFWSTSRVTHIYDSIIITLNSVYAIHDLQKVRNDKLKDLGI